MSCTYPATAPRWGVFEVTCPGKSDGIRLSTIRSLPALPAKRGLLQLTVSMTETAFIKHVLCRLTKEPILLLFPAVFSDETFTGSFTATAPEQGNHGPVRVNGCHFTYEDGTPYFSVGTTAYVWPLQGGRTGQQDAGRAVQRIFNKIRFCVFPKHYIYNLHEPTSYPYEGTPCPSPTNISYNNPAALFGVHEGNNWDFYRFNPLILHRSKVHQGSR